MGLIASLLGGSYLFFRLPEHLPAMLPLWGVHIYGVVLVIALGGFLRWMNRRKQELPEARLVE